MYFLMGGDPQILILQQCQEAGLLLGSSNPHPAHYPLYFPLVPPPITVHPAYPIHDPWTLSSSSNSNCPLNPTNPDGELKFVNFHLYWLVGCLVFSSLVVQQLCMKILVEFGPKNCTYNFLTPYFGWLIFEFL